MDAVHVAIAEALLKLLKENKEKAFHDELKKVRSYDAWQEFAKYLGLDYIFKE